jgi:FKBP-type peptidyl-prolyl cis-trans isomerase
MMREKGTEMKIAIAAVLAGALFFSFCFAEGPKATVPQTSLQETLVLKTEIDKVSYAVGVDTARNFVWSKVQLGQSEFLMGLSDVFSGHELLLPESGLRSAMNTYTSKMGEDASKFKLLPGHVSYALGVDMARKLKPLGIEFNLNALERGFRDISSGKELLIQGRELQLYVNSFQFEIKQRRAQSRGRSVKQSEDPTSGAPMPTDNKSIESMVTLSSGLQYKILKEGRGRKPMKTDTVEVNYRGAFTDGTEFDNSYQTGKSTTLKVEEAIPGWKEALTLMPVGSKWLLFIPPNLAYGEKGKPPLIGPNTTLFFELELLAIK